MPAGRLYQPGPTGSAVLDAEFQRISNSFLVTSEEVEEAGYSGAVMAGPPSSFTLNATRQRLENWPLSIGSAAFPGSVDPFNGTITVDEDLWIRVRGSAVGQQGNDVKEEMTFFELGVDGVYVVLALFDVVTDKTYDRAWNFTRSFPVTAGTVLDLWLRASSGLGTFTFSAASFEVEVLV